MTRQNLIINPSFKTDTTGWSAQGTGVSIARITTAGYFGTTALQITKAAVTDAGAKSSSRIAVTGSTQYAFSAYVNIPVDQQPADIEIEIDWYTAVSGGSYISSSTSSAVSVTDSVSWIRIGLVESSPSNALGALIKIQQPAAGTAGKTFLIDALIFEASSVIDPYFDNITQAQETSSVNKALTPLPRPWITGMKLQADIQINDLVLNTVDENGVIWVCTDIDGWWVHPDPAVPDIERGYGDGSYDVRGRWLARQITLTGAFLTPDPSLVPAARDKLIKSTSLVYTNGWLRVSENPVKASKVRLSGRPSIATTTARGKTEFSLGLRAADPIKYSWNGEEVDGYDIVNIPSANTGTPETGIRTVTNSGNTRVAAVFLVTGPMTGPGVIYNTTNEEFITIIQPLRNATSLSVTFRQLTDNIATLTTSATHGLISGDLVTVAISNAAFDGVVTVLDTPTTSTFTYERAGTNVAYGAASGTASIEKDTLEIDTYDHSISFNGQTTSARSMIEVLADWIHLEPGANIIEFTDDGDATGNATLDVYYRSGWIG